MSRFRRHRGEEPTPTPSPPTVACILFKPDDPQSSSPLFSVLPAEVRNQILALAFINHEDPSPDSRYSRNVCYARPGYFAPRRPQTTLLRTCRAVYRECRFLPFVMADKTFWLADHDRAPWEYKGYNAVYHMHAQLRPIAEEMGRERVPLEGIRVFTQMCRLEDGELESLLEQSASGHQEAHFDDSTHRLVKNLQGVWSP
ncbi:hypothetical protein ACHAPT_013630 [Fusarium lateritium]